MMFKVPDSLPRAIDWKAERGRIDLAAVVTRLRGPAPGRRGERGRKLWWTCPFHEDRNPSFCVDPGKGWWKCYGCGESGDAAALVMRLEGMTFPEAVAYLTVGPAPSGKTTPRPPTVSTHSGTKRETAPPSPPGGVSPHSGTKGGEAPRGEPSGLPEVDALALVGAAAARIWTPDGAGALAYLTGPDRRLSAETVRAARLGVTSWVAVPKADRTTFKALGVVVPWFASGRLALVKIRQPDGRRPKYVEAFRDPARVVCYPGPEAVRPGRLLIIVEGEFDALALGEALRELAPVVTLGSASARPEARSLVVMDSASRWYVSTDGDEAGDKAAAGWPARARRVRPPEPFKDWTEAKAAGVDLARWWGDILAGTDRPPLFVWPELARWRWGPAADDLTPGIDAPARRPSLDPSAAAPGQGVAE